MFVHTCIFCSICMVTITGVHGQTKMTSTRVGSVLFTCIWFSSVQVDCCSGLLRQFSQSILNKTGCLPTGFCPLDCSSGQKPGQTLSPISTPKLYNAICRLCKFLDLYMYFTTCCVAYIYTCKAPVMSAWIVFLAFLHRYLVGRQLVNYTILDDTEAEAGNNPTANEQEEAIEQ